MHTWHLQARLVARIRRPHRDQATGLVSFPAPTHQGRLVEAEVHHPTPRVEAAPIAREGIVGVDHRDAVLAQALIDFALGPGDGLVRAQLPDVGGAGIVHQRHRGGREPREIGDLPEMIHAHLDHRVAVVAAQAQEHERNADVVVQVPGRGQHSVIAPCRPQAARHHLLHCGLAVAAGDRHQTDLEARAPAGGEPAEPDAGVVYDDQPRVRLPHPFRLGHHRGDSPQLQGLVDELVPVEPIALQRDEQVAVTDLTAVRAHPVEARAGTAASGADLLGSSVDIEHRFNPAGSERCARLAHR